jgi:hypothetical protein
VKNGPILLAVTYIIARLFGWSVAGSPKINVPIPKPRHLPADFRGLDRSERHIEVELTVSGIQREMAAMICWRTVRTTGSVKERHIVARQYVEALKRHKRAEAAWTKLVRVTSKPS